jgi:hypothetical protein
MPDELPNAARLNTPPEVSPSGGGGWPVRQWLARHRRFAILGGSTLAFVVVALAIQLNRPATPGSTNTEIGGGNGTGNTNRQTFERFPTTVRADQDGDGLTDDDERQRGTRPDLSDSDGDGLTDREEVEVYQTDPMRQDTDGDGHTDAQEVDTGNNPNGAGLLRDLPQAIQQLNQSE